MNSQELSDRAPELEEIRRLTKRVELYRVVWEAAEADPNLVDCVSNNRLVLERAQAALEAALEKFFAANPNGFFNLRPAAEKMTSEDVHRVFGVPKVDLVHDTPDLRPRPRHDFGPQPPLVPSWFTGTVPYTDMLLASHGTEPEAAPGPPPPEGKNPIDPAVRGLWDVNNAVFPGGSGTVPCTDGRVECFEAPDPQPAETLGPPMAVTLADAQYWEAGDILDVDGEPAARIVAVDHETNTVTVREILEAPPDPAKALIVDVPGMPAEVIARLNADGILTVAKFRERFGSPRDVTDLVRAYGLTRAEVIAAREAVAWFAPVDD
jgi:hypothetical protein